MGYREGRGSTLGLEIRRDPRARFESLLDGQ
jgi:hypothetical protein